MNHSTAEVVSMSLELVMASQGAQNSLLPHLSFRNVKHLGLKAINIVGLKHSDFQDIGS